MTLDDKKDKVMRLNYTPWSSRTEHDLSLLEKDVAALIRDDDAGRGISKSSITFTYSGARSFGYYEDPKINRRVRWLISQLERLMRKHNVAIPYVKPIRG